MPRKRAGSRLLELFARANRVAEVGVYRGELSAYLLEHLPAVHLTMVDPWLPCEPYGGTPDDWDHIRQGALAATAFAAERRAVMRMPSVWAATLLPADWFDGVFLDADHSYASVLADLRAWWPKVKPGGVLAVHDYGGSHPGVNRAVRHWSREAGTGGNAERRLWWTVKR